MEETNGIVVAMKALGERIIQLESDIRYERLCKEAEERKVAALEEENAKLAHKLESVQKFIDRMEEQCNGDH